MKHPVYFLMAFFFFLNAFVLKVSAQSHQPYDQQWEKVKAAEEKGLTRSAWDLTKQIYKEAAKRGEDQQLIKLLIYQLKYRKQMEEQALVKNIQEVDSLARRASGVSKAILQSMAAHLYLEYVHENKYRLLRRPLSNTEDREDLTTWSLSHFYNIISAGYQQSLKNQDTLKKILLKDYTVIVDTGKNALPLRPSLYDLLAHDALAYFTSGESALTRPAQQFEIQDPAAFAPAEEFYKKDFTTPDSVSLKWQALKLFQDLIGFHLKDGRGAALMDVNLDRLQFVYREAVIPHKDSLYKSALEKIIEGNTSALKSKAYYLLAQWYYQKGRTYDPNEDSSYRWALKKALTICEENPDTLLNEYEVSSSKLKEAILHPELSLKTELVNIPGKPFRTLIQYKNMDTLWFRLVKMDPRPNAVIEADSNPEDLLQKEVLKQWKQKIPLPKDYQLHSTEIKMDALPSGRYALIASSNEGFNKKEAPVAFIRFFVSNISYLSDDLGDFLVLNRETGKPVKKAKVRIWKRYYNESSRKYEWEKGEKYKTNKEGYFHPHIPKDQNYNFVPEISRKRDYLFLGRLNRIPYVVQSEQEKTDKPEGYLFTDRSIYRPGQKLYFKGLVIRNNKDSNRVEVLKNYQTTIYLWDANHQKVDSLELKTNEFGSFAGTFDLPSALMNGRMHLSVDTLQAYQYFSVEEYKRPTYNLEWDSVSHEYRLGDTVRVSGKITAYNGSPENGATIKYQVTRKRYIIPRFRSYSPRTIYPFIPHATISQGILTADASGNFKICFPALPDEEIAFENRIFNFEVSLDVTNLSGESHHYNYRLPVGDRSLSLHLDMPEKLDYKDLDTLILMSTDLDGKFLKTPVAVSMYALKAPGRFIRERFWQAPDQFVLDKKEYLHYFPHDEYKSEADPDNFERGRLVYVDNDTTHANGKIRFYKGSLVPGWYQIKALARDKYGNFVTDSQYVQVYDSHEKKTPFHKILWTRQNEFKAQPGEKIKWTLGSSVKTYVFEKSESLNHKGGLKTLRLNRKVKHVSQSINSGDEGGIIKHYVTVKYNRIFTEDIHIKVPWKDKSLNISYETFRDKLLPGENETWKIKITGANKEKVNAELLASMYDVSLDNFVPHQWIMPENLYPVISGDIRWKGDDNFTEEDSDEKFDPVAKEYPDRSLIYPSFKSFGYNWFNSAFHYMGNPQARQMNTLQGYRDVTSENDKFSSLARQPAPKEKSAENKMSESKVKEEPPIKIRKDFRETAFFYPQLHTDKEGNVHFSFTAPEALTRWRLMLFAHTNDLKYAYSERETVTRQPLMIQMNAPRFVRQGDTIFLTARMSNLSDDVQTGMVELSFENTATGKPIVLVKDPDKKSFKIEAGQNTTVNWVIFVPEDFDGALTYTVRARSSHFTDGEQDVIPVLTNKALITESLPLYFQGNGTHSLLWNAPDKLNGTKKSVTPRGITIEYTGNPVWYAVQALPFLEEEIQKSADAVYRNIYANSLSGYIALQIPHFKEIMENWIRRDSAALKSPLQKNEEIKTVLLEETPWVVNAQSEAAQKAKIANWYHDEEAQLRLQRSITSLRKMQLSNGGFSWFTGMPDDRMITQQIVSGIGHLKSLHAWPRLGSADLQQILLKAVPYMDARMKEDYDKIRKDRKGKVALSPADVQYLYARSFFPDINGEDSIKTAYDSLLERASRDWVKQNIYLKALLALTFHRLDSNRMAHSILKSITENAIYDKNGGMHWKLAATPFYWYQNPIEMQAACLEAYHAIGAGSKTINALRAWLLSQKQTSYWEPGKATADAVYALLLTGTDWNHSKAKVKIKLGEKTFDLGGNPETGLQYQKLFIPADEVKPEMKNVEVQISGAADNQPSWGGLYFQYFEDMNLVRREENSGLHIRRQISLETQTPKGPVLNPVSGRDSLRVGDRVRVRLIVKADRDLDYVHLKDVRASGLEPLQVLSGYRWENGTSYYSTVTDAAIHFYFRRLPKGTYVFTYPAYIAQKGDFTGGMSQIECLYAPEIRAHSEGVRLRVQ